MIVVFGNNVHNSIFVHTTIIRTTRINECIVWIMEQLYGEKRYVPFKILKIVLLPVCSLEVLYEVLGLLMSNLRAFSYLNKIGK